LRPTRFAGKGIEAIRGGGAEMPLDGVACSALVELLSLQNAPCVDLVPGLARHELHRQQELERHEADRVSSDTRLTSDVRASRIASWNNAAK
jgi:hypothetical protein